MKIKLTGVILGLLASAAVACAGTNDITALVQKGLFEEEANHHLDTAIEYYKEAIGNFDKDRQLTATAIFRLSECYRLQGNTNEANVQYERIVREFSDQTQLVDLSKGYLARGSARSSFTTGLVRISNGTTQEMHDEQLEIEHIKDMIQNSPDLMNAPHNNGNTPLVDAVRRGWMSAVKLLLDNGAIINPETSHYTPLAMAAIVGNKGMVEFLISEGAKVNALNGQTGASPLTEAVNNAYRTVAETLLAHGADANLPDRDGDRPLHVAAAKGFIFMAELLLAHKAEVDARGNGGETALFRAAQNNHGDMIQFLVSNHANVNIKDDSGTTPLLDTAGRGDIALPTLKVLLDNGADANAASHGEYPLEKAILHDWTAAVELLLQKGANPNIADENGATPLASAVDKGETDIVRTLILHHADVNTADKQGRPPLACVISIHNGQEIRQMLIDAGADEDYQRHGAILITQKGSGSIGREVFSKGTNSVNHHTLFDLIATVYHSGGNYNAVAFPDLAHVSINRLRADGSKGEIGVNLEEILESGDCSKNPMLEWGDVVLIASLDHLPGAAWPGLSESERGALEKCLTRHVKIVVKGKTIQLTLKPEISRSYSVYHGNFWYGMANVEPHRVPSAAADDANLLSGFDLNGVVRAANVLLLSSDTSRVKVTRQGEKPQVMEFNIETQSPGVQLQDGDVIEIPEREQAVNHGN